MVAEASRDGQKSGSRAATSTRSASSYDRLEAMMLKVSLVVTMMTLGFSAARGFADAAPSPATAPVVVELFTSEGCSSCPPADKVLAALAKQPIAGVQIIPLAWHIDYWDRLGWRDPFSSHEATLRQYEYARRVGDRDRVYTPQMIVAGGEEFVGSEAKRAEKAIATAAKSPRGVIEITATDERDEVLNVNLTAKDLPPTDGGDRVQVLVVLTEDEL